MVQEDKVRQMVDNEKPGLSEHLKNGVNVLKQNPTVILPKLILSLASIIGGMLFSKVYGMDIFNEIPTVVMSGGDLTPYYPLFKIGAAYVIVGSFFELLFKPFIQHIYLRASKGGEVDFHASYTDTMARIGEYIVAQLIVLSIPMVILAGLFWMLSLRSVDAFPVICVGFILIMFPLLFVLYFLSLGTQIMVWEGQSFRDSIRLAIKFFKDRLGMLILLGFLSFIVSLILQYLPLNNYYSFIQGIFFNIVTIDLFLNYRKMEKIEGSAEGVKGCD